MMAPGLWKRGGDKVQTQEQSCVLGAGMASLPRQRKIRMDADGAGSVQRVSGRPGSSSPNASSLCVKCWHSWPVIGIGI